MIVVDTTIWIDFLAARGTSFDFHLKRLIEEGASVALTDIIYCEILQGIREEDTFLRTRAILRTFPIFRVRGLKTFEQAARIYLVDCSCQVPLAPAVIHFSPERYGALLAFHNLTSG